MKINDLEEGAFKTYCIDTCAKESVKKHFEEKDFRIYANDKNVIAFNSRIKEWEMFSNFHRCKLHYDGKLFHSTEQMFFYNLTKQTPGLQQMIMQQPTARDVKILHIAHNQLDTGCNHNTVMRLCLRTKFEQCDEFREALLSSKDKTLIEYAPWCDTYWGCYMKDNYYIGCNALGRLLMELRNKNL